MRFNMKTIREYLLPFCISETADKQGHVYHYSNPVLGDIYSTVCRYLDVCDDVIEYDFMENIAWQSEGINYGSLTFYVIMTDISRKILTLYFESEDAE